MVIATSDSNGTLVSLNNNGVKRCNSLDFLRASPNTQSYEFFPTDILLPEGCFEQDCSDDESFYSCSSSELLRKPSSTSRDRIYLPSTGGINVDECLKCHPLLMEICDNLLNKDPRHYTKESHSRVMYVSQREVAHAVPLQCDVIMSDKATTCHVLAFRSSSSKAVPLASLTHIDGTSYEACIRAIVQKHISHHQLNDTLPSGGKKNGEEPCGHMELDLHIVGGFQDQNGTSSKISNWLFRLLADVAAEEKHHVLTTLRTCAISSMNDNGHGAPIGRGLGINPLRGDVFLASCDQALAGPDFALRSLRLWSQEEHTQRLEIIHEENQNMFKVEPFFFAPFPDTKYLLSLSDRQLLKCTSTSPDCEEDDFCLRLRESLVFMLCVSVSDVFGPEINRTRYYKRLGYSNTWNIVHT